MEAARNVIMNKNLLKALPHLTQFCHTGELEVYHSLILFEAATFPICKYGGSDSTCCPALEF